MFPFVDKMSVSDSLLNVSKSVLNYATIIDILHTSFNETFGGWSKEHNQELYKEIDRVWETA